LNNYYRATACNATHRIVKAFLSVCLSVHPSVSCVDCDKTKETYAYILISHERTFILVFRHKELVVGDDRLYLKLWTKLAVLERKLRFLIDIRS